jgi:hypothetical protein
LAEDNTQVLLYSFDEKMRKILKFALQSGYGFDVHCPEDEKSALSLFREKKDQFNLVIYLYHHEDFILDDIIKIFQDESFVIPIGFIADKELLPGLPPEMRGRVFHFIEKTNTIAGLQEVVSKIFVEDVSLSLDTYSPVALDCIEIFDGLSNDLYIKLKEDKFVKLFREGDQLDDQDIEKYQKKGLEFFYIQQKTVKWVLDQVHSQFPLFLQNKKFKFVVRSPESSAQEKFEQKIIRVEDELLITKDFKELIEQKVKRAVSTVKKHPKFTKSFRKLNFDQGKDNYISGHISLLASTTCGLAKSLEWSSDITLEKLVYASLLHDITLFHKPELARIQTVKELEKTWDNWSEEDRKLFLGHPADAGNLVKSSFNLAPPETELIIFQHHERPDASGFPKKLGASRVAPLSALFIVAHDIVDYFINNEGCGLSEYLLRAENLWNVGPFKTVYKGLKKLVDQENKAS